jgi:tRNA nucleotidyltransferase/poly(A) polymerase
LDNLDLLDPIFPGISWDEWLISRIEMLKSNKNWQIWLQSSKDSLCEQSDIVKTIGYGLLLLRFDNDGVRKIIKRLKLSARYEKILGGARDLWRKIYTFETEHISTITKKLDEYSIISIVIVYLALDIDRTRVILDHYLEKWRYIKPIVNGNDLRKRGIKPGPQYRYLLGKIKSAWLDGIIENEAQETALLEEILAEEGDH